MATPFDTDYSFLNLPEAGSDVRGPIDLPSIDPVDSSFRIGQYAPIDLPETELRNPGLVPLSDLENQSVLSSARTFEDAKSLGSTIAERMDTLNKANEDLKNKFGADIDSLQTQLADVEKAKADAFAQVDQAIAEQDVVRQQAAEEMAAKLQAQEEQIRSEAEARYEEAKQQGIDALEEARRVAEERLQGTIQNFDSEIAALESGQQEALNAADQASAAALEEQKQNLLAERQGLLDQEREKISSLESDFANLQSQFGEQRSGFEGQVSELEQQVQELQTARDEALASGDERMAQALEEQAQKFLEERQRVIMGNVSQITADSAAKQAALAEKNVLLKIKVSQMEEQLGQIDSAQAAAIAERDQAVAEQDNIRAQAAEQQVQALEGLKQQLLTERESIVSGLEGTIGDLQGEIDGLTGARDSAIAERDKAIADQDLIRAEAAQQQADALGAQAGDYQSQLDELTGASSQKDQTISDLQSQLAALQDAPGSGDPLGPGDPGYINIDDYDPKPLGGINPTLGNDENPQAGGAQVDPFAGTSLLNTGKYQYEPIVVEDFQDVPGTSDLDSSAEGGNSSTIIQAPVQNRDQFMSIGGVGGGNVAGGGGIDYGGGEGPALGVPTLQVVVYGPDGTMYSSPAAAKAAGVTNYTTTPPSNGGTYKEFPTPGGGFLSVGVKPPSQGSVPGGITSIQGTIPGKINKGPGTFAKPISYGGIGGSDKAKLNPNSLLINSFGTPPRPI